MREANLMEKESCEILFQDILESIKKRKCNEDVSTTVAIALIGLCCRTKYNLNDEEEEMLKEAFAVGIQRTIFVFLDNKYGKK